MADRVRDKRKDPQRSFRVQESDDDFNKTFNAALDRQDHIPNATRFFISVMRAVNRATEREEVIDWPIKLVTKPGENLPPKKDLRREVKYR